MDVSSQGSADSKVASRNERAGYLKGVGDLKEVRASHSKGAGDVRAEDVALVIPRDKDEVKSGVGGGLFACCFGGGVQKAPRRDQPEEVAVTAPGPAAALAPAAEAEAAWEVEDDASACEVEEAATPAVHVTAAEPEPVVEGSMYCTVAMVSGGGGAAGEPAHREEYRSTPAGPGGCRLPRRKVPKDSRIEGSKRVG